MTTTNEAPEVNEETPEVEDHTSGPKELREALKRSNQENKELRARVMKDEFAKAGLDPTKGLGKAIAKEYDGELDAEAIKAYASEEYGWEAGSQENPLQPQIDAGNERLEQVQNSSQPIEANTLQEKARKAAAEGDMVAAANAKAALLRAKMNS